MLLLSSEYPPPQRPARRPVYALLSPSSSGARLCLLRLLLDRLRRFSRLSEGEQFSTEVVALPFGLFAPALLFRHSLAQRGLRHLTADPLGAELLLDFSQLAHKWS